MVSRLPGWCAHHPGYAFLHQHWRQISPRIRFHYSLYVQPSPENTELKANMISSLYFGCIGRCSLRNLLERPDSPRALPLRPATFRGSKRRRYFRPPCIQDSNGFPCELLRSICAGSPHPAGNGQPPWLPRPISCQLAGQLTGQLPPQQCSCPVKSVIRVQGCLN